MKLIKVIVLFAAMTLVLSSCGGGGASPLSYQKGAVGAVCDVDVAGETLGISIEREGDEARIVINSPECVKGSALVRRGGEYLAATDRGEVTLPDRLLSLADPIFDALSLPDAKENVKIASEDGKTFVVTTDAGRYTVTLDEAGMPSTISFKGARDFTLKNISVIYKEK